MLSLATTSLSFALHAPRAPAAQPSLRMQAEASVAAEPPPFDPVAFTKSLPGVAGPLGFFDPLGFCAGDVDESKIRFFREAELKHGRVAMLAAFGFLVGERFHPLFGGEIDVPSYVAFQATPLQEGWKWVLAVIGVIELASIETFYFPIGIKWEGGKRVISLRPWTIRPTHKAGDFGFDPLSLKPTLASAAHEMHTKELNNGRTAMIAIAGMVAQELVTGAKL